MTNDERDKLLISIATSVNDIRSDIRQTNERIDKVEENLTNKIDEVDKRLTNKIDEVDKRLTKKINEVNNRLTEETIDLQK